MNDSEINKIKKENELLRKTTFSGVLDFTVNSSLVYVYPGKLSQSQIEFLRDTFSANFSEEIKQKNIKVCILEESSKLYVSNDLNLKKLNYLLESLRDSDHDETVREILFDYGLFQADLRKELNIKNPI